MVRHHIIERVGDEVWEWCHPVVIVPKLGGDVRIVLI